jgi:hypothetical protein
VKDPRDLEQFGAIVRHLLDHPEEANTLGSAGHDRALHEFLPDTSLEQWQQVVVQAMQGSAEQR